MGKNAVLFFQALAPLFELGSRGARYSALAWAAVASAPHPRPLLGARLFEAVFTDSGHWDFLILAAFDFFSRAVLVASIGPGSEFSISERAAWLFSGFLGAGTWGTGPLGARGFTATISALSVGFVGLALIGLISTFAWCF